MSKESLPNDSPNQNSKIKTVEKSKTKTTTRKYHDDFGDLLDYIMLDSNEREKHRIKVDRLHPVVETSREIEPAQSKNPTIAELKHIPIG